jgi:hypothetical protein
MGRRKLYITSDQQVSARRVRQMKYYKRNKDKINEKNLGRYYNSKNKD